MFYVPGYIIQPYRVYLRINLKSCLSQLYTDRIEKGKKKCDIVLELQLFNILWSSCQKVEHIAPNT